jgi:hypothetical protein
MNAQFAPALSFEAVRSALAPFALARLSAVATAIRAVAVACSVAAVSEASAANLGRKKAEEGLTWTLSSS